MHRTVRPVPKNVGYEYAYRYTLTPLTHTKWRTYLLAVLGEENRNLSIAERINENSTANPVATVTLGSKLLTYRVAVVEPADRAWTVRTAGGG